MKSILKNYKVLLVIIVLLLVVIIGSSFAILRVSKTGKTNVLKAGFLYLDLDDSSSNGISLNPTYPLTDREGKSKNPYIFTVTNTGNITADYAIYLDDITEGNNKMDYSVIRFNLNKKLYDSSNTLKANQPEDLLSYISSIATGNDIILDSGTLQPNEKNIYKLNLWLDYNAGNEYQGSNFKGNLRITSSQKGH